MENFENILNSAIDRCDGKIIYDKAFNKGFERIYPFATENISGYIDTFNLKNKKLHFSNIFLYFVKSIIRFQKAKSLLF